VNRKGLGNRGEETAAAYLEQKGYAILERQYRTPVGEIDLIAREGKTLVFVEVKTRRSARYGQPSAAVGWEKQRRIIRGAMWYMMNRQRQREAPPCRFDVVEVYATPDNAWKVRHLENAFEADEL
jgi:putative endonuclease